MEDIGGAAPEEDGRSNGNASVSVSVASIAVRLPAIAAAVTRRAPALPAGDGERGNRVAPADRASAESNDRVETSDATIRGAAAPIVIMICPRCQASELAEFDRDGITLDRCPSCRGIWLDRGELEKLLTRGRTEHDEDVGYERELRRSGRPYHSDDSSDRHRIPRRRSWWEIFD